VGTDTEKSKAEGSPLSAQPDTRLEANIRLEASRGTRQERKTQKARTPPNARAIGVRGLLAARSRVDLGVGEQIDHGEVTR
jgi:hypothetical protein